MEYMRRMLPRRFWARVMLIKDDIRQVTAKALCQRARLVWPDFKLSKVRMVHASPSCRTYSPADRGFSKHRGAGGRPLTRRARDDDDATSHAVELVEHVSRHAPRALVTIENPRSRWFKLVPCIARLIKDARWEWLTASYCKNAHPAMDPGMWPRKDTNMLVKNVLDDVHTEATVCRKDCKHLVFREDPPRARHAVVVCSNPLNRPEQKVITDPLLKGRGWSGTA